MATQSPVFSPAAAPGAAGGGVDDLVLGEGQADQKKIMSAKLHAAVNNGESVAELLDTEDGDLDLRTKFGEGALHRAVRSGTVSVVNELLEAGADIECRDEQGKTPLMTVCSTRAKKWTMQHQAVAMRLLEAGADPLVADNKNGTALSRAAAEGHLNLVLALLKVGAAADSVDINGKTPLMLAAHAHTNVVEVLLRADANAQFRKHKAANANAKDATGKTPLIFASIGKNAAAISLLLDKGKADPFAEDEKGKNAMNYCRKAPDAEAKLEAAMRKGGGGGGGGKKKK
eukprot:SAG22_NODE_1509_length_4263_cov_194.143612_4_plen_287_part_00